MGRDCVPITNGDGRVVGVACFRTRVPRCGFCPGERIALCDHRFSTGKTCDAALCEKHRTSIGPNLDACPIHRAAEPVQPTLL